jgi:hypothetical protein
VTKIARLNKRDLQDIEACITQSKVTSDEILERIQEVGYAGGEQNFEINTSSVILKFFPKNISTS